MMKRHSRSRPVTGISSPVARHLDLVTFLSVAALILAAPAGHAQNYPVKGVRIIVPVAPGGGTDTQARLLARKFQESMGQPFVVENRTGAASMIGTEFVVKSPADGYTLLFAASTLAGAPTLRKDLSFDLLRDLTPVGQISSAAQFLVVHASVPVSSVKEFIALAKRHGKMNAASGGIGSANHLTLEMLKQRAGIQATHIAYKGSGPATIALMSGEVDFSFAGALTSLPHIRSGRIKALAVTTPKPSPLMPGAPPLTLLYPGFESTNWYGIFAPAGTPEAIVNKISQEMARAIQLPDVREFMAREGADPVGSNPQGFARFFRNEVDRYAQVIRAANIRVE